VIRDSNTPGTTHDSRITIHAFSWKMRMLFWLTLAAATAWLLWYMVKVPGVSYAGALKPLTEEEKVSTGNLRRHVSAIASREHNVFHPAALEASAQYIERTLAGVGYAVLLQRFRAGPVEVRNIEVEVRGGARASEIVLVGAHYDSVVGAVGANDNGSGVAALLELARLFKDARPARTLRFVAFVNEEPPFYHSDAMGSRQYARRSRERGESIAAMSALPVSIGLLLSLDGQLRRFRLEPGIPAAAAPGSGKLPPPCRGAVRGRRRARHDPGRGLVRPLVVLAGRLAGADGDRYSPLSLPALPHPAGHAGQG
jgi:hypothetical protein